MKNSISYNAFVNKKMQFKKICAIIIKNIFKEKTALIVIILSKTFHFCEFLKHKYIKFKRNL